MCLPAPLRRANPFSSGKAELKRVMLAKWQKSNSPASTEMLIQRKVIFSLKCGDEGCFSVSLSHGALAGGAVIKAGDND